MRPRSSDSERGIALPPWVIGVSIGIVVVAMLTFVVIGSPDRGDDAAANPTSAASSAPSDEPSVEPSEPAASEPSKAPSSKPDKPHKPEKPAKAESPRDEPGPTGPDRSAYVEVYNNTSIDGLANETAAELQDTGWKVVGADNWYGDIPDSTVYYPARLRDVAKLLAADLGIDRLHTAVAPMRFDRLTVILTGPP
jgi:LytR cell envelope-related transcriptional attenuator